MNVFEINAEKNYVLDGQTMVALRQVMSRMYDDSKPLVVNEKRDIAQRLHALLENAGEIDL